MYRMGTVGAELPCVNEKFTYFRRQPLALLAGL